MYVSDGAFLDSCSSYDEISNSDEGMRVNCKPFEKMHEQVIIQSLTNQGISLSEVEVHTLGKFCCNNINLTSFNTVSNF